MSTLTASASSSVSSFHSIPSQRSLLDALPSPPKSYSSGSASSSSLSLNHDDEENVTITANRVQSENNGVQNGSTDNLQLLAISTRITEISYSISDIQTRIFEIQELRHKSQSGDNSSATRVIDQSLASLDERLESVSQSIKSVNDSLNPLLESVKTPTPGQTLLQDSSSSEDALILRKHATMLSEWDAVQKDSQVLREELKEDKWLTVFRTVTDQADGMMSSLEKAVNRCQDFIYQVQRRGIDDSFSQSSKGSTRSEKPPTFEVLTTLLDSFEAKKKHYMPATTKVLAIIDKGVQDRVTKNGECLRRHAESTQRWKNLKERITRTDIEMENVRKLFLSTDVPPSSSGSSISGQTHTSSQHNGYLATPPSDSRSKSRTLHASSTISRSISPFRKLARKLGGKTKSPKVTPVPVKTLPPTPSSEPVQTLRHRASLFNLLSGTPPTPTTPDRPGHKYSHSLTPDSSPSSRKVEPYKVESSPLRPPSRPAWNSSTRVDDDERERELRSQTVSKSRRPSVFRRSEDVPPIPGSVNNTPSKRSVSRSSMASSRPWSPVTSSVSTASNHNNLSMFRPPSRATTPGLSISPRTRPKTPSSIPAPAKHWRSMSATTSSGELNPDWEEDDAGGSRGGIMERLMQSRAMTPSGHPPRPPSRSMIPVPSVQISGASRPGSAMSHYRPESSMSYRGTMGMSMSMSMGPGMGLGGGRRTPDAGMVLRSAVTPRPGLVTRMMPSSFKDSAPSSAVSGSGSGSGINTPSRTASSSGDANVSGAGTPSRPGSRAGAATPNFIAGTPIHPYIPASTKDPLDMEVARVVNGMKHGLLIERVDPPLRVAPKEGEEVRGQYAVSSSLGRKVVSCKLATLTRVGRGGAGPSVTKKVMCRVGGGWQDLRLYIVNRQAGM